VKLPQLRRRRCACCSGRFAEFEPYGRPPRPGARCPGCGALERHRELCARIEDLITPTERVLHFAPEACIERVLRPRQARYVTTDMQAEVLVLLGGGAEEVRPVDVQADITRLPFRDGEFDVVLVNHVLEHVPDDRAALRELHRVLTPGGRALMQHPMPGVSRTIEDSSVTDPADRLREFGQEDHVRVYAESDFRARVREAGFVSSVIRTRTRRDIQVCTKQV